MLKFWSRANLHKTAKGDDTFDEAAVVVLKSQQTYAAKETAGY